MTKLLSDIELYMRATKIPATRFGRLAVGDSRLILDLQCGRTPGPDLEQRVRTYIEANPEPYTGRGPDRWHSHIDDELWQMLCNGTSHAEAARHFGVTTSAVSNRARYLRARRIPELARRQRLIDALAGLRTRPNGALLSQIEAFLVERNMTPQAFGWAAGRDSALVTHLRQSKNVSRYRLERARAYLKHGIPFGTGKRSAKRRA